MKPHLLCACLFLTCLLGPGGRLSAQRYFKVLDKPLKSYAKKIARFPNGDVLLADAPLEVLTPGKNIGIFLMRLDPCGNAVWANKYELGQYYLDLSDVKITAAGEIFLYGSAYANSQELIFLAKLGEDGAVKRFRLFNPLFVDHFTFSIDLDEDRILAYGLLLHWNVPKRGFVAIFNRDLNFQWGKSFSPFESTGTAIITRDGGFLCRSGPHLVQLDAQGQLQWATTLADTGGVYPVVGPLDAGDGFLFGAYHAGRAFFYKVSPAGQLLWKSATFPATKHAPVLARQPDGNVLAAWNSPGPNGENEPCLLLLSPDGDILLQHKLMIGRPIDTGPLSLSADGNTVRLAGSAEPYITQPDTIGDFLLQFSLDSLTGDCFQWEPLNTFEPNNLPLVFTPLDTVLSDAQMQDVTVGSFAVNPLDALFPDICTAPTESLVRFDTLLPCTDDWVVSLPGPEVTWDDGATDNPRLLRQAGVYRATSKSCSAPVTYEYVLRKQACSCAVYLPNVFSPNEDGVNDRLEISSQCPLQRLRLRVYDRWGNRVFESDSPDAAWDGRFQGKPALPGVYVAAIDYQVLDNSGTLQEGARTQAVTLLR